MIQKVDLNENRNLFVVSVILIAGVGGLTLSFGEVTITSVACSLILGILVNVLCSGKKPEESAETPVSSESAPEPAETSAENAETAENASDEAAASETDDSAE